MDYKALYEKFLRWAKNAGNYYVRETTFEPVVTLLAKSKEIQLHIVKKPTIKPILVLYLSTDNLILYDYGGVSNIVRAIDGLYVLYALYNKGYRLLQEKLTFTALPGDMLRNIFKGTYTSNIVESTYLSKSIKQSTTQLIKAKCDEDNIATKEIQNYVESGATRFCLYNFIQEDETKHTMEMLLYTLVGRLPHNQELLFQCENIAVRIKKDILPIVVDVTHTTNTGIDGDIMEDNIEHVREHHKGLDWYTQKRIYNRRLACVKISPTYANDRVQPKFNIFKKSKHKGIFWIVGMLYRCYMAAYCMQNDELAHSADVLIIRVTDIETKEELDRNLKELKLETKKLKANVVAAILAT